MGKKGLELPVSVIVIIAIAVLVLVVTSAFFISNFGSGTATIGLEQAFAAGCTNLRALYGCQSSSVNAVRIPGYNPAGSQGGCNLGYVCRQKSASDTVACAKLCGCQTLEGESGQGLATSCEIAAPPSTSTPPPPPPPPP